MNPLDKEEFTEILKIIKNDMPHHTDETVKIKSTFSQGFPKNLMDYSVKIDNKFLNDYLAIIEEINHKDPNHCIPKAFQEYQNNIYGDKEILNHDNFFKAKLHDSFFKYQDEYGMPKNTHYMRGTNIQNVGFLGSLTSKVFGATLERINDLENNSNANTIICTSLPSGTAGQYYNQLTIKSGTTNGGSGNIRLGLYDDISLVPTNLAIETGSITAPANNDYTPQSVTEFQLPTNNTWFAHNESATWTYRNAGINGTRRYKIFTFGAFQNPVTSLTAADAVYPSYCKISHS